LNKSNSTKRIVQPQLRFRPRNDIERIFDTIDIYGKYKDKVRNIVVKERDDTLVEYRNKDLKSTQCNIEEERKKFEEKFTYFVDPNFDTQKYIEDMKNLHKSQSSKNMLRKIYKNQFHIQLTEDKLSGKKLIEEYEIEQEVSKDKLNNKTHFKGVQGYLQKFTDANDDKLIKLMEDRRKNLQSGQDKEYNTKDNQSFIVKNLNSKSQIVLNKSKSHKSIISKKSKQEDKKEENLNEIQNNFKNVNEELRYYITDQNLKFATDMTNFKENPLLLNFATSIKGKQDNNLENEIDLEDKLKYLQKLAFPKEQRIKLSTKLGYFKKIKQSRQNPNNKHAVIDPITLFEKQKKDGKLNVFLYNFT